MPFSQIIPLLPLPQSPKDCSIHLCLFCSLAYRVIVTIFLNSIYMVLEKTSESPFDSKEIKPVNLRGLNPEYSLEGLILKLKLLYFGHLM